MSVLSIRGLIAATALAFGASAGVAAPVSAVDVAKAPAIYGSNYWNAGFRFTANTDLDVVALGNYDYQQNGFLFGSNLPGRAEIGLFDLTGNLLASATINGAEGYLVGAFRYLDLLSPVRLSAASDYVIATWSNDPRFYFKSDWQAHLGGSLGVTVDDRIALKGDLDSGRGTGLAFPTISRTDALANIGPNMLIDAVQPAPVPVPAAGVMLVTALGGLAVARRRKRA
ncbi:VPLPA-CTERM sorting domain-containing protein [Paracoccus sp. S3-43]|uniref:VPLPA-CTERM sorting domain-containing protein n=1 Tax=Paracoccus sp. S3-43 TaxID=3030011 RepID=UPI0023AEE35F|nr:VPLPA-CTERM sorting domain-containing protein [Paracoccus sp. S3-43]WEF22887.1 VPLPA-CTERM sorting domain-containing protein [Paracoccus sp. S3-43]